MAVKQINLYAAAILSIGIMATSVSTDRMPIAEINGPMTTAPDGLDTDRRLAFQHAGTETDQSIPILVSVIPGTDRILGTDRI